MLFLWFLILRLTTFVNLVVRFVLWFWEQFVAFGNFIIAVAGAIGRALLATFKALKPLWTRVLKPGLKHLGRLTARFLELFDRVMRPIYKVLHRIRAILNSIYERFLLPVIALIQVIRVMLSFLRITRIGLFRRLDEKMAALQGKLFAPIAFLLRQTSVIAGHLNLVMTARFFLQRLIFLNSSIRHIDDTLKIWWEAQRGGVTDAERSRLAAAAEVPTREQTLEDWDQAVEEDTGPLAEAAAAARETWDAELTA